VATPLVRLRAWHWVDAGLLLQLLLLLLLLLRRRRVLQVHVLVLWSIGEGVGVIN
jgi:hypothetical protein